MKKKKTEDQYRNTTSEVELVTSKDDEFVVIFSSPLFLSNLLKDDQLAFLTVNGRQRQQVVVDTENERTNEQTNEQTNERTNTSPNFFFEKNVLRASVRAHRYHDKREREIQFKLLL